MAEKGKAEKLPENAKAPKDWTPVVNVKIDDQVRAKLDEKRSEVQKAFPGINPTNPDLVRMLILR